MPLNIKTSAISFVTLAALWACQTQKIDKVPENPTTTQQKSAAPAPILSIDDIPSDQLPPDTNLAQIISALTPSKIQLSYTPKNHFPQLEVSTQLVEEYFQIQIQSVNLPTGKEFSLSSTHSPIILPPLEPGKYTAIIKLCKSLPVSFCSHEFTFPFSITQKLTTDQINLLTEYLTVDVALKNQSSTVFNTLQTIAPDSQTELDPNDGIFTLIGNVLSKDGPYAYEEFVRSDLFDNLAIQLKNANFPAPQKSSLNLDASSGLSSGSSSASGYEFNPPKDTQQNDIDALKKDLAYEKNTLQNQYLDRRTLAIATVGLIFMSIGVIGMSAGLAHWAQADQLKNGLKSALTYYDGKIETEGALRAAFKDKYPHAIETRSWSEWLKAPLKTMKATGIDVALRTVSGTSTNKEMSQYLFNTTPSIINEHLRTYDTFTRAAVGVGLLAFIAGTVTLSVSPIVFKNNNSTPSLGLDDNSALKTAIINLPAQVEELQKIKRALNSYML